MAGSRLVNRTDFTLFNNTPQRRIIINRLGKRRAIRRYFWGARARRVIKANRVGKSAGAQATFGRWIGAGINIRQVNLTGPAHIIIGIGHYNIVLLWRALQLDRLQPTAQSITILYAYRLPLHRYGIQLGGIGNRHLGYA